MNPVNRPTATDLIRQHAPSLAGPAGGADSSAAKKSQASQLLAMADQRYRVTHNDVRAYAVPLEGAPVAIPMRGTLGLRERLAADYYTVHQSVPSSSALTDALVVLEGRAFRGPAEQVDLRVAGPASGSIEIDLGDATGRRISIDAHRWHVADETRSLFRRSKLMSEIPPPRTGPDGLRALRRLVQVDEPTWRLLVGWLLASLIPDIPHPVLTLTGEQGTAKSFTARLLRSVVDPSPAELSPPPRDVGSWALMASSTWIPVLDNISVIPAWLSDALCRAATGDAFVTRQLYSDDDISVLNVRRPIILTGISLGEIAGDLAERMLLVELGRIAEADRREEREIRGRFEADRDQILAGLLDLLVLVLQRRDQVETTHTPRMADFARLLLALDDATGWATFEDYLEQSRNLSVEVVESDLFAQSIAQLAEGRGTWEGTAEELRKELQPPDPVPKSWPATARAVSGALKRCAPQLEAVGVHVEQLERQGKTRRRLHRISATSQLPLGGVDR